MHRPSSDLHSRMCCIRWRHCLRCTCTSAERTALQERAACRVAEARASTAAVIDEAREHTAYTISRAEIVAALGRVSDWGDPYGPPVYISQALYDAGKAAGYDMRYYAVQQPLPMWCAQPGTYLYHSAKHLARGRTT